MTAYFIQDGTTTEYDTEDGAITLTTWNPDLNEYASQQD